MPGKKLLVADDSLTIQKVIRLALSNEGYDIQTVSDGNDAIQQITLSHPQIVLIDVSLPGKTAFEVKQEINSLEELQGVRFVLMSSAFEKVDEALATEVGFDGRLTKPFDPAHLRQVLNTVLSLPSPSKRIASPPAPPERTLSSISLTGIEAPELNSNEIDQWETSNLIPSELPELPQQTRDPVNELWDPTEDPTGSHFHEKLNLPQEVLSPPPPPPPFPSPPPASSGFSEPPPIPTTPDPSNTEAEFQNNSPFQDDNDIKELTESTIKITGLDDFQWSVKEPVLKPPPKMMDRSGSLFDTTLSPSRSAPPPPPPPIEIPDFASNDFDLEKKSAGPMMPPPPSASQNSGFIIQPPPPPAPPKATPLEIPPHGAFLADPTIPPPPLSAGSGTAPNLSAALSVSAVSQEEIQKMVQEQVEETLHKAIQKLLPDLAERLIKQEIHRILSE